MEPDLGASPTGKGSSATQNPSVSQVVCIWILIFTDFDTITWRTYMLNI